MNAKICKRLRKKAISMWLWNDDAVEAKTKYINHNTIPTTCLIAPLCIRGMYRNLKKAAKKRVK